MRKLWMKHNRVRGVAFDILDEYGLKNNTNFEHLTDEQFNEMMSRIITHFIRVYHSHHYTSETDYDDYAEIIDNFMK